MSRTEVLSPSAPIEYETCQAGRTIIRSQEESFGAAIHPIVSPTSPIIARSLHDAHNADDEVRIPHMPPLLRGHSEVHLRNGVMRASRLAAVHEPDAEKAFFVADLSYVYKQHVRWKRCLPNIEPFYGPLYFLNYNMFR